MLLVLALSLTVASPAREATVWRYPGEVRALLAFDGRPVAATAAGVFVRDRAAWRPLGKNSPPGLVTLAPEGDGLMGIDAAQRAYRLRGDDWRREEARAAGSRTPPALDAPPSGSKGAFLSATVSSPEGTVQSYWGDTHLWRVADGTPRQWIARSPTAGDYALLRDGTTFYAGTPEGVFAFDGSEWRRESLEGALPLARPHGLARVGSQWVVGGLQGLWMGAPGGWAEVDRAPVRQMLRDGDAVWVLFGNGALDKLEPRLDRRHPDVLHGAARRPWGACLALGAGGLMVGSEGGWIEKRGDFLAERYPEELKGQVVTAIAAQGETRFVGTQKGGLYEFSPNRVRRFNAGNGLRDAWVTALAFDGKGLNIATAGAGLFTLRKGRIAPRKSPLSRPRHLAVVDGALVAGGMEGAWRLTSKGWQSLATGGEETTALSVGENGLAIVTAAGIHFVIPP